MAETGAATGDRIEPGLHLVSVPIGAARDITLRALDVLRGADVLAAEDTRSLRRLMAIHGVDLGGRPLLPYHDHNGPAVRPRLLAALREGQSVAYASEAGTPLIADPGFALGVAAQAEGLPVRAAPGASAVLAALCVAGLSTDRFLFAGFLPPKSGARRTALKEVAEVPATLVFYESPRRLGAMLSDASEVLGPRDAAVCRELTKRYEDVVRGPLDVLAERYADEDPKGEIVVVIDRGAPAALSEEDLMDLLAVEMETVSLKTAVKGVSEKYGVGRNTVYEAALKVKRR
ncbi:ribosomal RNA small subunit methyltransferase I [Jannaschia pagri]|uniref:Ribosomal RNA small subunit methyltransferase I n=1 Tax=Jannaschia pagri TaxID=2829797 RepID=A0ABQ4NKW7_9RHOB|nr:MULTISPECIES: 16S rRNA (cytidine(1402)-2'-O)-methyltransferase [unclassified Jannaschia]GIT91228.1 ribosomal RNA small subunit methyltransferase I [Jannaschia sp. AI_61]GIT95060.1 ribosomal RNA small subunit methyltransferase I [Jannaschia sp. AI_62]